MEQGYNLQSKCVTVEFVPFTKKYFNADGNWHFWNSFSKNVFPQLQPRGYLLPLVYVNVCVLRMRTFRFENENTGV